MSRIEKGGNKFRPVARPQAPVRPKPPVPRPAAAGPSSTPAGEEPSSSAVPAPSQLPEVGQTQESTLLQSQASTQPPPSTFPASTQSLDLTPAVERSAQPAAPAATEEIAIPVRPPKPVNPYLDRVAPPPAFSPPSLKEQLASGPRGGGRVAPRLALSGGPQGGSGEQQDGDEVGEIITAGSSRPPASSFALPLASPSSPTLPIPRNARAPALVSGGPESSPLRPSTRSLPPSASAAAASSTSLSSAPVTGGVQESTASGSHQPPPAAAKKRTATGPAKKRAPKRTRLAATPELDVVDVPEASHSIAAGANAPHLAATGEGSPPPPEATQAPPFRSAGGARAPRASRSKRSMAEGVSASEDEGPVAVEVADVTVPVGESESSHAAGSGGDDDFPDMARAIDHGVSKAAAGAAAAAEAKKAAATGAKGKAKAPAARKPRAKKGAVVTDGETTAASGTEMEAGTEVEGETEVERETEAEGRDATDVPGQKPPTKRRHRKKKPPAVGDAVEAAVESEGGVEKIKSNRRVHRKTGGKSGRPSKTIKTPPPGETGDEREDEAQEEERPFNLSTATMSELCVDPGVGRISTRFEEIQRKAADLKEARKRARLRMKQRVKTDREGGRAFDEPSEGEEDGAASGGGVGGGPAEGEAGPSKGSAAALDSLAAATRRGATDGNGGDPPGSPSGGNGGEVNEDASDDEDYGAPSDRGAGGANRFVPQMRVVNGQLILDQDSLQIDQHAEAEQEANAYEEIEERDLDRFVNQDTWRKKPRGERWGKDETELFYDALQQFGSDFEMIARLFPGRTRKMIKNKFTREERINEARVTRALTVKIPVDMRAYEKATRKDFSGPPPVIKLPTPPPPTSMQARASSEGAQSATSSAGGNKKRKRGNARDGEEILGLVEEREPTPEPVEMVVDEMDEFM